MYKIRNFMVASTLSVDCIVLTVHWHILHGGVTLLADFLFQREALGDRGGGQRGGRERRGMVIQKTAPPRPVEKLGNSCHRRVHQGVGSDCKTLSLSSQHQ